ncbi:hypothetical protein M409DRAFT_58210 [Zasmidium cellare ATCC 36951]|uniref:FAR-17a/AIG1-like protein n=1 Tax=Zasmidium cellare ATCC 36951 TaxID=1080233 RepID=A0A6A6C876_ZASCE|nr:uncharacterized protein M409DRAFT_58210 [Zasmidium cellare ATCC 36951]KAF2162440.1 hypothetical protein M409DRAFT_58210 [Zasmidium cellare ATCC 36951]
MTARVLDRIRRSYQSATTDLYIEQLCTSWILPTWLLGTVRAILSVYAFTTLFYIIGYRIAIGQAEGVQQSFSYFTVLGYWGLAFYFAFAALHTTSYALREKALLQSWPTWLKYLHSVFYATVTVFPFIVTAVYWAVLSKDAFVSQFSTWSNISEHAMNSAFAFVELALPRSQPHPWTNLAPLIFILALYLSLAYLTHETEGIYVYDFLDPSNGSGSVAGYCFAILAACIVIFVVVRYLQLLRQWLTENKFGTVRLASTGRDIESMELSNVVDFDAKHSQG